MGCRLWLKGKFVLISGDNTKGSPKRRPSVKERKEDNILDKVVIRTVPKVQHNIQAVHAYQGDTDQGVNKAGNFGER